MLPLRNGSCRGALCQLHFAAHLNERCLASVFGPIQQSGCDVESPPPHIQPASRQNWEHTTTWKRATIPGRKLALTSGGPHVTSRADPKDQSFPIMACWGGCTVDQHDSSSCSFPSLLPDPGLCEVRTHLWAVLIAFATIFTSGRNYGWHVVLTVRAESLGKAKESTPAIITHGKDWRSLLGCVSS